MARAHSGCSMSASHSCCPPWRCLSRRSSTPTFAYSFSLSWDRNYIILCFLFLCVCDRLAVCSAEPHLELEAEPRPQLAWSLKRTSCINEDVLTSVSHHDGQLKVVTLNRLDVALASQSAASVMTALYATDELLTSVCAAEVSYAIISYRQVRCKSDDFTLDADAFMAAVSKAREAGVDAIWLDGWCYRQQGPYNHAAFCAELAAVMRYVTAVIWLPRSRANATPSYQFRLWCTFEASVVAYRRLPVFIAGKGIATSQTAMKHLGIFFFAFPGLSPPPEVRSLAYVNATVLLLSTAALMLAPFFVVCIVSGTLGIVVPRFNSESAYARNGQMVLRAMADGVKRAMVAASAGASVKGARQHSRGDSSTTSQGRSSTAGPNDSIPRMNKWGRLRLARRGIKRSCVNSLQRMLPWLPAYDRRDALVVRSLLDMMASELSQQHAKQRQREGDDEEAICALAASCFSAAKLQPSAGDPVGKLDVQRWLAQKAIYLPMARPLPLAALAKFGWRTFRGCPDQFITPAGRLRVMDSSSTPTPTPRSEWDASQLEAVREAPIAWQLAFAGHCLVGAALYVGTYITLAVDFTTAEDADNVALHYTIWLMATVGWLATLTVWLALFGWHIRYPMADYPHPVHVPSFAMILGGDGYDALKDYLAYIAFHVASFSIQLVPLLVLDTAAFTRPSALFNTVYSFGLARERHPVSGVAAPAAYAAMLAGIQAWSIHFAIDATYVTWHMWHCGRRAGRGYFIRSPDTKSTTVVRFAADHTVKATGRRGFVEETSPSHALSSRSEAKTSGALRLLL